MGEENARRYQKILLWIIVASGVIALHASLIAIMCQEAMREPIHREPARTLIIDIMPVSPSSHAALNGTPIRTLEEPQKNLKGDSLREETLVEVSSKLEKHRQLSSMKLSGKKKSTSSSHKKAKLNKNNTYSPVRPASEAFNHQGSSRLQSAAPMQGEGRAASTVPPSWRSIVIAHINHYKKYPFQAQQRGEEGTAFVQFTVDRSGSVLSYHLESSSDSSFIDKEALDVIQRASPFPALPSQLSGNMLTITIPIRFSLE